MTNISAKQHSNVSVNTIKIFDRHTQKNGDNSIKQKNEKTTLF